MSSTNDSGLETVAQMAAPEGGLTFKDEGEDEEGLPFGTLTLRSSPKPVYPDGRWVTKWHARELAVAWGVELFEY